MAKPPSGIPDLDGMKDSWNRRATENARYYIATTNHDSEEQFDASGRRDVALFFEDAQDLLGPDRVVLDIGCGIGRMDRHVAPLVGRLIGVDVSGEMIRRARRRLAHLRNVEFLEVDGSSLRAVADASADLVFSHIVFQHIPRQAVHDYFREAHRVLNPGGHFLFQVPEAVDEAPEEPPDDDTFEMRYYEERALRRDLEEIGFAWEGCRRFRVESEKLSFDHLRPRLRKL